MLVQIYLCAILVALIFSPILLMIPRLSSAAEWLAEPSVRMGSEYNDNIRLTIQPHNSVNGSTVAPKLNLGVRSDVWQLSGGVEYERKNYSGANDLDTDNQYYNLASTYEMERSIWRLNGLLAKASVLADQKVGIDNQGAVPVIGLAQTHRVQETHNITPSWTWSLDERKQLQLSYQYSGVSYVDGSSVSLSDYSSRTATAKLTNQLDLSNQVFFSVDYSVFRVPNVAHAPEIDLQSIFLAAIQSKLIASESKSTSYQAGITHNFSETLRGTISGGTRKTSAEQVMQTCSQPNFFFPFFGPISGPPCFATENVTVFSKTSSSVFNGNLENQFEKTRVSVGLSRGFNTSGVGDEVRTDSVSLGVSRSMTAKLTGNLSATAYKYSSETGNVIGLDSRAYQIEPSLRWQLAREWNIDTTYRYTHLKRATEAKPVTANAAYLSLIYQWPKMSISR